ncbi:MAG: Flp family type IVb pilin [Myxococcales bacterium]|nr:Flp family type IVb pilin [Myxococcales bacterium]
MLQKLFADEEGATAVEYGMISALLVLVVIGSLAGIRVALQTTFVAWSSSM